MKLGKSFVGSSMLVGLLVSGCAATGSAVEETSNAEESTLQEQVPTSRGDGAESAESPESLAQRGCTLYRRVILQGRDINLWLCGNYFHGQIASAAPGDSVWLSPTPDIKSYVQPGNTFVNTPEIYKSGPIPLACGHIAATGAQRCTCSGC
ncbi:hypothetical protein [Pendulispora albinea]|uniref:Lipoprotein n=1 Tax=Pendulispora albinea TaxID=2741071 RepID=A0ABZ2LVC0_9BACT